MMSHTADYFAPILDFYRCVSHFKSNCFCELFSCQKNTRKLIAGVFSAESAVIDCLHHDVGCDPVS